MDETHIGPIHSSGKPSAPGEPAVGVVPHIDTETGGAFAHLDHIVKFDFETDPVGGVGFQFSGKILSHRIIGSSSLQNRVSRFL